MKFLENDTELYWSVSACVASIVVLPAPTIVAWDPIILITRGSLLV